MKNRVSQNSGMTLIELLIAISLLAFFVIFMPRVFQQTAQLYKKATVRSELDRLRQVMMISIKNVEKTKQALLLTLGPQRYDELYNCFGQKGPGQATKLPGADCNKKFSANGAWADLIWPDQGSVINKHWSTSGECNPENSDCLMNTWAKYYISCASNRCFSVSLLMGMTPTDSLKEMPAQKLSTAGFSSSDLKEKRFQSSFPATMFGLSGTLLQQPCQNYVSVLDFNYMALLCDPNFGSPLCKTSLSSFNDAESSCEVTGESSVDGKTTGSFQPGAIDVSNDNSNVSLTIIARAEGTGEPEPTLINGQITMQPRPLFDASRGDKIVINCPPIIGIKTGFTNPYSVNVTVNLSSIGAGQKITCNFYVTAKSGSIKGTAGQAELLFYDSTDPGGNGGGGTPTPTPGGGGGSGGGIDDIPSISI